MTQSRSSEAVDKLLDIASKGGICIGSAEDRVEDVGGIIHYEHIQLYVSFPSRSHCPHQNTTLHGLVMLHGLWSLHI